MSTCDFIMRTIMQILYVCLGIFIVIIIIGVFISPTVKPRKPNTRVSMIAMAETINGTMRWMGYTNIAEYVYYLTGKQEIPQILTHEIIQKIINEGGISPDYNCMENGDLIDTWKQPIIISIATNHNGEVGLTMHSFGKNKIDEKGAGDDIFVWFNVEMSSPMLEQKNP